MRVLEVASDADAIARILHRTRAPPAPPPPGQLLLLPWRDGPHERLELRWSSCVGHADDLCGRPGGAMVRGSIWVHWLAGAAG